MTSFRIPVKTVFVFTTLLSLHLNSQNLVPNPSFEQYWPDSVNNSYGNSDVEKAKFWENAHTATTPDYFNSDYNYVFPGRVPVNDNGNQYAHTGNAYAGIYTYQTPWINEREYIRSHLSAPLLSGHQYAVSFYVSHADKTMYSTSLGAYLSNNTTPPFNGDLMMVNAQIRNTVPLNDNVNWQLISDTIMALGGEEYLVIGTFDSDANSDTMNIGTGTYDIGYYYIDDVSVTPLDHVEGLSENNASANSLSAFPNPLTSSATIRFSNPQNEALTLRLFDAQGKCVREMKNLNGESATIDRKELSPGVYFLQLSSEEKIYGSLKLLLE